MTSKALVEIPGPEPSLRAEALVRRVLGRWRRLVRIGRRVPVKGVLLLLLSRVTAPSSILLLLGAQLVLVSVGRLLAGPLKRFTGSAPAHINVVVPLLDPGRLVAEALAAPEVARVVRRAPELL